MHLDFEQIKGLITSGELEKAVKMLEDGTENTPLNIEASFLQAREFKHRSQSGLGLSDENATQLEYNKITFAALELLEKLRVHFMLNEMTYSPLYFYETAREVFTDKAAREYMTVFKKENTRHIGWELGLQYPPLVSVLPLHIVWIIYYQGKPNGKFQRDFTIDPSWNNSWVSDSWGYQAYGQWQPGSYRVEILVCNTLVSKGDFTVVE